MALRLVSFAPIASQGGTITETPPNATLNLVGVAPLTKIVQRKSVPSSILNLVSNTPKDYVSIPKKVPGSVLTLSTGTPVDKTLVRKLVPSAVLTLIQGTPLTSQSGQIVKQVPSATLRLISFAPNIPSTAKVRVTAGGGPKRLPGRIVIIGGRRYRVESHSELKRLLETFLNQQKTELVKVEAKQPKSKRVRVLKANITRTETRLAKAEDEWIERENEELILMLVA